MTSARVPAFLLVTTAALLAVVIGCSHPLQVDVPAGYSGRVTVQCERLADDGRPIHVDADGVARHATCPRSRASLTVVRDGRPVKPSTDAQWSTTGDGIVLGIEFNVD